MTAPPFHIVSRDTVHDGFVIRLDRVVMVDAEGGHHDRDVVAHPGAVSVVAVSDDDQVVLVRQYRVALDDWLLELPAGKRDVAGEPPIETARRELAEEAGFAAARWEPLVEMHHSPGFCDEYGYVFLATGLSEVPMDRQGVEEESMSIEMLPLDEAVAAIAGRRITDAKTQIGLLMALHRLGRAGAGSAVTGAAGHAGGNRAAGGTGAVS